MGSQRQKLRRAGWLTTLPPPPPPSRQMKAAQRCAGKCLTQRGLAGGEREQAGGFVAFAISHSVNASVIADSKLPL